MAFNSRLRPASGLTSADFSEIFNPVIRTEYAKPDVYRAPVNQQAVMLRAIEALRIDHVPRIEEVDSLTHG